ncbi:ABC transporter ATP-binding protein [Roseitranquillus sediminis]|uniref:ABC transporter ATP-binding protein n=1 Tax=Roseitranquillus sediminis TaxID=2809051 RepID=UPI001D0BF913|nr:ABC transporter ATP-binding protein [Roseitranquillus sediminis]MBM9596026.1 ABC transporter ATP-binding protein [Roseitranquillus sediminis]
MISLQDISFAYPSAGFRLEIPRLAAASGERLAVVGPSGSGKTTLLSLVAGILVPFSGSVRVGDVEVHTLGDVARRDFRARTIGSVFQDFGLVEYLSARDNILHPYRISGALTLDGATRKRAEDLAWRAGIGAKLGHRPGALSHGEKQRVAICRALLTRPPVVLADEATGNLDPETKGVILDLLFSCAEAENATVLAVTHDHDLLDRFDRVVDFRSFRQTMPA